MTTVDDHRMRLVPADVPHVFATTDAVNLQCSPGHAEILAKMLAHYDVLLAESAAQRIEGYDPVVWHHTLVELFTAKARMEMRLVPFLPVDQGGRS